MAIKYETVVGLIIRISVIERGYMHGNNPRESNIYVNISFLKTFL